MRISTSNFNLRGKLFFFNIRNKSIRKYFQIYILKRQATKNGLINALSEIERKFLKVDGGGKLKDIAFNFITNLEEYNSDWVEYYK